MRIRPAAPSDAPILCELLAQLGYPATVKEIPARLRAVASFPRAAAFVATNGYGEVVGLATVHIFPSINGRLANGAKKLSVASGMHRRETHALHEKRDYENTGLRFTRKLTGG